MIQPGDRSDHSGAETFILDLKLGGVPSCSSTLGSQPSANSGLKPSAPQPTELKLQPSELKPSSLKKKAFGMWS